MPTKFRKNVWIKRGDYVLVQPIEEGDKVRAEIVQILMDKYHVKYIKQVRQRHLSASHNDLHLKSSLGITTNRAVSNFKYSSVLPPTS